MRSFVTFLSYSVYYMHICCMNLYKSHRVESGDQAILYALRHRSKPNLLKLTECIVCKLVITMQWMLSFAVKEVHRRVSTVNGINSENAVMKHANDIADAGTQNDVRILYLCPVCVLQIICML